MYITAPQHIQKGVVGVFNLTHHTYSTTWQVSMQSLALPQALHLQHRHEDDSAGGLDTTHLVHS